jgi:hypothetical protein
VHRIRWSSAVTLVALAALGLFAGAARAVIAIDANVSKDQGAPATTVTTASFGTHSGNELLLALVSADNQHSPNTTVTSVSGGSLVCTNGQRGTAEIWRAFAASQLTNIAVTATLSQAVASSLTVMSFTGVDTGGTNGSAAIGATASASASKGAPSATLVTTRAGSLVIGVGTDWDNAIARTPGAGQSIVHQYLAPVGDTYWIQMRTSAVAASGTSVTINDTAPTSDMYNLSICEILPRP